MARSHADAFLEAILQDPDDDTPRLIFADWLEEQGDSASAARAEFIRVQCTLAKGHLPPGRRATLERREWTLLLQYGSLWAQPVRRLVLTWEFQRGFVGEVTLWGGHFLSRVGRLFRRAPIQHVRLFLTDPPSAVPPFSLPALADCKQLRRLRSLDLTDNGLESSDVRALVVSEHLSGLLSLNLSYNRIGDAGARALADAPILAQLTHLDLCHNTIRASGACALAEALKKLAGSSEGLRLRRLELGDNSIGTRGRGALRDSPRLRRLVRF